MKKISFIIPVLNEDENISHLTKNILENLDLDKYDYEIIFIDDGSTDSTRETLKNLKNKDKNIKFISFIKNFGHQIALKAGYDYATGDAIISLDGDMQHPPEKIKEFLEKWENGAEIVHGIKQKTEDISFVKNFFSKFFYFFIWLFASKKIKRNLSDYRLISKKVCHYIKNQANISLFFRLTLSNLEFNQDYLYFVAKNRKYGKTKYNTSKNLKLAFEGISSISDAFIILNTIVMFVISLIFISLLVYIFYLKFFTLETIPGQASILVSIFFIGIILLSNTSLALIFLNKILNNLSGKNNYIILEDEDHN